MAHDYDQIRIDTKAFISTVEKAMKEIEDKYPQLRASFYIDWQSGLSKGEEKHRVRIRFTDKFLESITNS